MQQVAVWDFATRAFHWLLVAAVLVCFVTGEDEGLAFFVHAYAGFMVFVLLAFRLGWGFFGSRHSLFSDFRYSWSDIRNHVLSILYLKPKHHVGHNPVGGLMIFAMLGVLACTTTTGVVMVVAGFSWLKGIHEVLGSAMQILVVAHIGGVIFEQVVMRQKLIQAMVTGSKDLPPEQARQETPPVSAWRSLVLAALVVIAAGYVFSQTDYGSAVSDFSAKQHQRETGHS